MTKVSKMHIHLFLHFCTHLFMYILKTNIAIILYNRASIPDVGALFENPVFADSVAVFSFHQNGNRNLKQTF